MLLLCLVAQFLTVSGHWITTLYKIHIGLVHLGGGPAADAFYNNLSNPSSIAQVALFVVCNLLTDFLVVIFNLVFLWFPCLTLPTDLPTLCDLLS
ncbi:hypothetical protein B0H11DRAFT_2056027 [Mycena galericulata]|nr:hypothetical protein B0H11DRAFT_2056027 [Mycena galericulata]